MPDTPPLGHDDAPRWTRDPMHRAWCVADARRQLTFFDASLRADGGFDVLAVDGSPLPRGGQELHTTTRMIHSYALGQALGHPGAERMIDAGMAFLWDRHRDAEHGGYMWSVNEKGPVRADKLAYGHVFVLLAASSAKLAGHPDADRLLEDIRGVLEARFWDEEAGLLREEFARDWTPLSDYRGMNANMHGAEAMLAAFEATGEAVWLERAGRILSFFTDRMASANDWRIPEHYHEDWTPDPDYAGDPMFRPKGTTPGHSVEFARLLLQHWDLSGRADETAPARARALVERALDDAWWDEGGLAYTLEGGRVAIADRYWWPVAEAIGAIAALQEVDPHPADEATYRGLWRFARDAFVDPEHGGWFPEVDAEGRPASTQFEGKPDIYHALQADLYPIVPGLSRKLEGLGAL